jgi:hypothetical protein
MKDELIEELELDTKEIAILGEAELRWCDPVVGQTLALIVKNRDVPTADLEGVCEIEHCLKSVSITNKDNLPILCNFVQNAGEHFPTCASILLAQHLGAINLRIGSLIWPERLMHGFRSSGIDQPYQLDAVCNLIAKITRQPEYDSLMKSVLKFDKIGSQGNVIALLGMAYSAVQKGVVPTGKTPDEALEFLENRFVLFMAPNGHETLTRVTRDQVSPQIYPDLSREERANRVNRVINPLFDLSLKTASQNPLFGDDICEALNRMQILMGVSSTADKDIRLNQASHATQLVLETLLSPTDVLERSFRSKKRGSVQLMRLSRISDFLQPFTETLMALPFDAELKTRAYRNLFNSATGYMLKLKDRKEADSDRLLNILAPHVDLVEIRNAARPSMKAFLFDYMCRHHGELVKSFNKKERGKFLESELGL